MVEKMISDEAEEMSPELRTAKDTRLDVEKAVIKDPLTLLRSAVDKFESGDLTPEDVQELSNVMLAHAVRLQQDREKTGKNDENDGRQTEQRIPNDEVYFEEEGLNFFGE